MRARFLFAAPLLTLAACADADEATETETTVGEAETARIYAKALAARKGAILPLVTGHPDRAHVCHERHLCVDTTAAGGNADLLAKSAG